MKRLIALLQLSLLVMFIFSQSSCSRSPGALPSQSIPASHQQHIALLLPLTGTYAPYADAIKNGFFTALYEQKKQTGTAPDVTVFDTNGKNIETVYEQAVSQGANLIVGPLDKANVTQLANSSAAKIPVLALNTISENHHKKNNVFEFSLSPTDEARSAAEKAWQDKRRNVIIIAPQTALGDRVANAFTSQWTDAGGTVVAKQSYTTMATLSADIRNVLGIASAYQNEHQIRHWLHQDVRFIPEPRRDFDSIFLVATPAMARQIQPLLKFYFVGNVPVFSTSAVYAGAPNPSVDNDINGILFCEIPWVLTPNQLSPNYLNNIQQQIQTLWPNKSASFSKFYAFGVDAFFLTTALDQLQSNSSSGLPGATGTLYLTPQHVIHRELLWAQMQDGQPKIQ
ncbi:MAG: hypothetical protein A3I77_01870 [Gammaproteobacteria bacterium RIFCSPLOWO2_02_FULL_42_14]|nr:MAG: hypothetical protein A3B71_04480 [Gammaproteobacteria bacterium RIFCSPHIGHO2_02_FULL_42_43]OGT50863.1 MAG: hypothetical protein A3E54_03750 [Gammaproteobacteria bacterium RIFCSPHIGHO2_12_FULL_41_25]OGT62542.1 MAG: hypothetical protein A3I77_01870 [Gammaproteobacteria bacterium RIFCSPLOWO2_02_FULL_42_14]OGT86525.1 MAG: hypothetical protein A3G86_08390 [Gammaproteobacteria bacterium RIFCSPLOWO2_12_FULL_42_18]